MINAFEGKEGLVPGRLLQYFQTCLGLHTGGSYDEKIHVSSAN